MSIKQCFDDRRDRFLLPSSIATHRISEGQQFHMRFAPSWISSWREPSDSHLMCQEAPALRSISGQLVQYKYFQPSVTARACHLSTYINPCTVWCRPTSMWCSRCQSVSKGTVHQNTCKTSVCFNVGIWYFRIDLRITRTQNALNALSPTNTWTI